MVQIKKISCIIGAIFFIALSAFLPVSAEEIDMNFLQYSVYYRVKDQYGVWGNWVYPNNSFWVNGVSNTLTDSTRVDVSNSTTVSAFDFGFGACMGDENGGLTTLQNSYSYIVSYSVNITLPHLPQYDIENFTSGLILTPGFYPGNDVPFPIDDVNFDSFQVSSDYTLNNSNNYYVYYTYFVTFVFNVPSDLTLPNGFNWLSLIVSMPDAVLDSTGIPKQFNFTYSSIEGTYDPSGAIADTTDADKIIEGQKEAAEYALAQEQEANEQALNGAYDQDTSGLDISNIFGSSLISLYNAMTYNGTTFDFKLPSSGTVPFLNTVLWEEHTIPIKEYIDKVPSVVWIVLNFLLWFLVIRRVIKLVHLLLDFINGNSSGG